MRSLSLPHIASLSTSPPELVEIAVATGFQWIGVRLVPSAEADFTFPMREGGKLARETRARLAATGIKVLDVELMRLASGMSFDRYRPALAAAAYLGATNVLATGNVSDTSEAGALFDQACSIAAEFGLTVNLEFLPMLGVKDLPSAKRIVIASGCDNAAVMVDTLHVHRGGATLDDLKQLEPSLVRYIQICDAGPAPPDHETMLYQAKYDRMMPGEGVIPIRTYLDALPATVPLSVEVPNIRLLEQIGTRAFAQRAFETSQAVLRSITEPGSQPATTSYGTFPAPGGPDRGPFQPTGLT